MTYTIELPDGTVVKGDDHEKVVKMAKEMRKDDKLEIPNTPFDWPDSSGTDPKTDPPYWGGSFDDLMEAQNSIRRTNKGGL